MRIKAKYVSVFTVITFSILLSGSLFPFIEAQAGGGPVFLSPGDMIGSAGNGGTDPGSIFIISQTDGSQIFIGDPTVNGGLSGIAFDGNLRLWGSNVFGGLTSNSNLLQINSVDGSLIDDVGPIQLAGEDRKIQDLAWDPISDELFGTTEDNDCELLKIDRGTAVATLVGILPNCPAHIGFTSSGTLYMVDRNFFGDLFTIDPTNANVLTQVVRSPFGELDALGVDPSTGIIWVSDTTFSNLGSQVLTIDEAGNKVVVGSGLREVADIAFVPFSVVGGESLSVDTTALVLAGLQSSTILMLPVLVGAAGAGMFYIKTRLNKE